MGAFLPKTEEMYIFGAKTPLKLKKMKIWDKFVRLWCLNVMNPVVVSGEKGGFRYVFRRYTLELRTVSGNWRMRVTACEHPWAYLRASVEQGREDNVFGFAHVLYYLTMTMTTDQRLVDDVQKALVDYDRRLEEKAKVEEDPEEEKAALEEVRGVQEYAEMGARERRKYERAVNRRFKRAAEKVRSARNLKGKE